MKYFKFWVKEPFEIRVGNQVETIKLLVGSNVSKAVAAEEGALRAKVIEERIAQRQLKPLNEYDAAIKEHVAQIIDDKNIVTVCRYGAKIWNTTQYTILDLDQYRKSWFDIFKPLRKLSLKERIVFKFEENLTRYPQLGGDFRVYETAKGIRVICRTYLDPAERAHTNLLHKLNVDWLYVQLSNKQKCYRARLTPKPYRMRIKTIKLKTPLDCETQAYENWAKDYDYAAQQFSVVRLVKTIGRDFSREPAIEYHDQMANLTRGCKLA